MRYAVYKSLDKTNSLFGIKGTYQKYAIYGLAGSVLVGLIVGSTINSLIGTILGIALVGVTYAVILSVQSKFSERERVRYFCSKRLPDYITVPPRRMRRLCQIRTKEKK